MATEAAESCCQSGKEIKVNLCYLNTSWDSINSGWVTWVGWYLILKTESTQYPQETSLICFGTPQANVYDELNQSVTLKNVSYMNWLIYISSKFCYFSIYCWSCLSFNFSFIWLKTEKKVLMMAFEFLISDHDNLTYRTFLIMCSETFLYTFKLNFFS